MKKILIITNHSYMFWQFRRELVRELIRRGHRVTLALPFGDRVEQLRQLGCELVDTPMERRGTDPGQELTLLNTYRRVLDRVKPDLVVTYSIKPNIYAGAICGARGIPFCANVQGIGSAFQNPVLAAAVSRLYRGALRKARVVFFENEENARLFRDLGITREEKQCVLSGAGVNLDHYVCHPYPEHDGFRFLFLGRLMKEKGLDELLTAVERLHQDGERFCLDVAGFEEEDYKARIQALEDRGICTYHGFSSDTRELYADTDCLVLPSWHEGMSNVLLEAAASGRPIITSDIPGCREAVEEGITGLLTQARDSESLYRAMKAMLALDRHQRAAMGLAGRKKMQRQFDKNQVVEMTIAAMFREE